MLKLLKKKRKLNLKEIGVKEIYIFIVLHSLDRQKY